MRKWINGELVEGTPEELAEYERIVNEKGTKYIPFDYVKEPHYTEWFYKPSVTCSCGEG